MKTIEELRKDAEWYAELLREDKGPPVELKLQQRGREELAAILNAFLVMTDPERDEEDPNDQG